MSSTIAKRSRQIVATAAVLLVLGVGAAPAWAEEPGPTSDPSATASAPEPSETSPAPEPSQNPTEADPTGAPPSTVPTETAPTDDPSSSAPAEAPFAEPPAGADVAVTAVGGTVTRGSTGKRIRVDVRNNGPREAYLPHVLTVDVAGLTDAVQVTAIGRGCERDGTIITCALPALEPGRSYSTWPLTVRPAPGATLGNAGTYTATAQSSATDPELGNNTDEAELRIVESAVDLVVTTSDVGRPDPGDEAPVKFRVTNSGDIAAHRLVVTISLPKYVLFSARHAACRYSRDGRVAECDFGSLAPGASSSRTEWLTIAKNAPHMWTLGRGSIRAVGQADDADPVDDTAYFTVWSGENDSDLALTASKPGGQIGDTVKVRLTAKNLGPGDIAVPTLIRVVKVPKGTTLVSPRDHKEFPGVLAVGTSVTWTISLRIDAEPSKPGKAYTAPNEGHTGFPAIGDRNPFNNEAPIVVSLGSGGGGSGGGDGLPLTGASLVGLIAGGTSAVLLGALLYVVALRRRPAKDVVAEHTATS